MKRFLPLFVLFLFFNPTSNAQNTPRRPSITAENASEIVELARLEKGSLIEPFWLPGGKTLYVTGSLGIWRFDLDTLDSPQLLSQYHAPMAVSPDGITAAALDENGRVVLWDCQTGQMLRTLFQFDSRLISITDLAFNPEGTQIAVSYFGGGGLPYEPKGGIEVRDIQTGEEIAVIRHEGVSDPEALAYSPDGTILAAGGYTGTASWNTTTWKLQEIPFILDSYVDDIEFNATGEWLAFNTWRVSSAVTVAQIKDWKTTSLPTDYGVAGSQTVTGFAFSPIVSDQLASAGIMLELWNLETWESELIYDKPMRYVSFNPEGNLLAATDGATLFLYDIGRHTPIATIPDFTDQIKNMRYTDDGSLLLVEKSGYTWYASSSVRAWNTKTLEEVTTILPSSDLSISPFEDYVSISRGQDEGNHTIWLEGVFLHIVKTECGRLYDIDASVSEIIDSTPLNTPVHTFEGHVYPVNWLCLSPDKHFLATADVTDLSQPHPPEAQRSIRVWDVLTGQQAALLMETPQNITVFAVVFSLEGDYLAVVEEFSVAIWDTATWQRVCVVDERGYDQVVFVQDASAFILRNHWGDVRILSTETCQLLKTIDGLQTSRFSPMLLGPDGILLALASDDGTVRIWGIPQ